MEIVRDPVTIAWGGALDQVVGTHPDRSDWHGFGLVMAEEASGARRALDRMPPQLRGLIVVVLGRLVPAQELWDLLEAGAGEVLCQDATAAETVVARFQRWAVVESTVDSAVVRSRFVGRSPILRAALRELVELAMFGRAPIMLTGETGTGKELAAQVVHELTVHRGKGGTTHEPPAGGLVVVDCTTIVPSLSGSELFGHERGAFTGADRARVGAVKQADGGTLFLDEIGELPNTLQAELLRVIQEGRFKTVGGTVWGTTSFRLVSATHRNLERDQRRGRFRSDLFHRVAASTIRLPPLRDRLSDVPDLFTHFLAQARHGERLELSPGVSQCLCERSYPGNVRQLRQLALLVATRHVGSGPVTVGDIPPAERPAAARRPGADITRRLSALVRLELHNGVGLQELKALVGDLAVEIALVEAGGNLKQAAERLGVTPRALQLRRQHA